MQFKKIKKCCALTRSAFSGYFSIAIALKVKAVFYINLCVLCQPNGVKYTSANGCKTTHFWFLFYSLSASHSFDLRAVQLRASFMPPHDDYIHSTARQSRRNVGRKPPADVFIRYKYLADLFRFLYQNIQLYVAYTKTGLRIPISIVHESRRRTGNQFYKLRHILNKL